MSGEGISQSEVLHDITASFHDDQRSDTLCQVRFRLGRYLPYTKEQCVLLSSQAKAA